MIVKINLVFRISVEMHFVGGSSGPRVDRVDIRRSQRVHISKKVAELRGGSEMFGQQASV